MAVGMNDVGWQGLARTYQDIAGVQHTWSSKGKKRWQV